MLVVVGGGVAEGGALWLVVVDPELGLLVLEDGCDALERGEGLVAVDVHGGHAPLLAPRATAVQASAAKTAVSVMSLLQFDGSLLIVERARH